jgi:hypothetical protein
MSLDHVWHVQDKVALLSDHVSQTPEQRVGA